MAAGDGPRHRGSRRASTPTARATADLGRVTVAADLAPGQTLRVVKFLAYGWSSQRSLPALRDQVVGGARRGAAHRLGRAASTAQRAYLDDVLGRAPTSSSTATPSSSRRCASGSSTRCRPARGPSGGRSRRKGLTGSGYDGHTFWDTETFVLPVLTYTAPSAARDALRWRHATLDLARERAAQLGLAGAAFPWRTIRGQECSGYWPAGTAAFHINADIADAVIRYLAATDDEEFERDVGLELLVETARLWRSLGHHDAAGRASASTASPAPTSTARSPTTTSTRT